MPPAAAAITVILFGLTGLMVMGAASEWIKLARDRERTDQRPTIPIERFRSAAAITAVAMGFLSAALLWVAFLAVPWGE